jgi:hypothetical protein
VKHQLVLLADVVDRVVTSEGNVVLVEVVALSACAQSSIRRSLVSVA